MQHDAQSFSNASGIQADVLALTLQTIGAGVAILVFAWIVLHILSAYQEERIKSAEAFWNAIKATLVLMFVLLVIFT
ncbi:DUF3262 family protein [Lampropedia puyangensis]|uniref:DUF3262 family protein n=1 Tax=Lampropedia puyangensis TaxID=1330072 RepID=A0A4S8EUG8_9BURK|nr:DUF3262 family protein [Lampropedia puyangensis]THT98402.1 DUF3262 family protein [Lampropedia puyangensis]